MEGAFGKRPPFRGRLEHPAFGLPSKSDGAATVSITVHEFTVTFKVVFANGDSRSSEQILEAQPQWIAIKAPEGAVILDTPEVLRD